MNIIVNKYLITSFFLIMISLLIVVLIFITKRGHSKVESFDDFSQHTKILNNIIKEKTSSSNLSKIPILNGQNPNVEIQKKFSSYTPIEDNNDDENQDASVNLKKLNNQEKKKNPTQNKPKENIIINKSIAENSCKYIPSYDSEPKCPPNYRIYSGASMGIGDGQLSCNGQIISNDRAEARSILEDGSLKKISITNGGNNYRTKPIITIIGDGTLASASCTLKNGKVSKIIITNPGKNYSYPPKIEFSKPDGMIYCHLCCQDLNTLI